MKIRNLFITALALIMWLPAFSQKDVFSQKYIEEAMLDAFEWQQVNPKHAPTDWTNGAYYVGVSQAYKATKNKAFYDGMVKVAEKTEYKPGNRWYHADDITICQTYIDIYNKSKATADLKPTKEVLDKVILYVDGYEWKNPEIQIINWWWCDALFMGPPTFVKYGVATDQNIYLKASDKYYRECYDLLYDKAEDLWARDLNYVPDGNREAKMEENGKKIFWSRGNGWVFGGLALVLQEMPKDWPNREFYEEIFVKMAARLKSLQPADGAWRSSMLNPAAHQFGETSGTGFFVFGLAWGIRSGYLKKEDYLPSVKKGWKALVSHQQDNGMVGFVQPIGAAPSLQVNKDSWEVYGTGAFLCAGAEVMKLNIDK